MELYVVLKDFSMPVAVLTAAVSAAVFARVQANIAREKLKLDMWKERYAIYDATKKLIEHVARVPAAGKYDPVLVRDHYVRIDEARFFFSKKLRAKLKEITDTTEQFLMELDRREIYDKNDQEKWSQSANELGRLVLQLTDYFSVLPELFEPELAFKI